MSSPQNSIKSVAVKFANFEGSKDFRTAIISLNQVNQDGECSNLSKEVSKLVQRDPYLKRKSLTHYPVLEHFNKELEMWGEIDPECHVLPSGEFLLKMCPIESPKKASCKPDSAKDQYGINVHLPIPDVSPVEGMEIDDSEHSPILIEILSSHQVPVINNSNTAPTGNDNVITLDNFADPSELSEPSRKMKKRSTDVDSGSNLLLLDNFPTPDLSERALEISKSKEDFLLDTNRLVREVAQFLLSIVANPTKEVCSAFTTALILKYPTLADMPSGDESKSVGDLLLDLIYTSVRNHKSDKNVPKEDRKRGNAVSLWANREKRSKSSSSTDPSTPRSSTEKRVETHEVSSFEDQCEILSKKGNKNHCRLALDSLDKFKAERRAKMMEFESISLILKTWPLFMQSELIVHEFWVQENLTPERIKPSFETFISNIASFFGLNHDTELQKLECMQKCEDYLRLPVAKSCPHAITITELRNPLRKPRFPNSLLANGPITVTYVTSSNTIASSYLLAEKQKICNLSSPTAFDVYTLLVSSYYTFYRSFPKVNKNFFEVMDKCILNKTISAKSSKMDNILNAFQFI